MPASSRGSHRRLAHPGEKLLALNGREYELDPEVTAIADAAGVQSLGGVIGGEATSCTEATTELFVEAALFDPIRTAATGRRLEIISDARYRFERGVDPAFVGPGLEIATRLILELCGGEASEIVVAGAVPDWQREYTLRPERLSGLGGLHVPPDESTAILVALGCTIAESAEHDGSLRVTPPSWRGDIEGEADLVEEILRVKGYDEIPAVPLPRDTVISRPAIDARRRRVELVRRTLASRGLIEAVTFSFISARMAELFGGAKPELRLVNPISADLDAMRPSALPGLVDAARRNADRGFPDVALFELGPAYRDDTPEGQMTVAAGLRAGRLGPRDWRQPPREPDLYTAKADALAALAAMGAPADNIQASADPPSWYHPGRAGTLRLGPTVLGHFGELHPDVLDAFEDANGAIARALGVCYGGSGAAARGAAEAFGVPAGRARFRLIVDRDLPAETLLRAARGVGASWSPRSACSTSMKARGCRGQEIAGDLGRPAAPGSDPTDAEIEAFSKRLVAGSRKPPAARSEADG